MKSPLVSVVIVNWNGKEIISECLNALFAQSYKNIEVIIVDNNSSDNSVLFIKRNFKHVKVIENKVNLGFAGGNNSALPYVTGNYILLLNTDAIVTKNFLKPLISLLTKSKKTGIVQPLILYTQNPQYKEGSINSAGSLFLNTGFLYYPSYGKNPKNVLFRAPKKILSAYGACMLIKKEVVEKIGLFDDSFFMYFEETDFCMRALVAGYDIYLEPNSKIYHKGGVSTQSYGISKVFFHSFKNRIASYIKNLDTGSLIRVLPLHIITCEITSILYLIIGKFSYFISIQRAFLWNAYHLFSTLRKRKDVQKLRTSQKQNVLSSLTAHPRISYYLYLFKGLQYYKE